MRAKTNLPVLLSDTKKPPSVLEADYYFPIQHRCPNVADFELFYKESLHSVFHPKEKNPPEQTNTCDVKLRLTTNGKLGVLTPIGFLEQDDAGDLNTAREITTYRDSKAARSNENLERRSRSVQDLHAKALERSNSYLRIKRLLKFSKDRKPLKADDDEDEGYSSKTSSAEQRCSESDGEESACNGERLEKKKIFSSMVDLSELPSNSKEHKDSTRSVPDPKTLHEVIAMGRGKFNYTHQPTILQLPNPDITLTHDKLRVEKKLETEDSHLSYAKLKRSRELNKGYKAADFINHPEESTVYSIDNGRPVTLVLRKISIQNADQQIPATYRAVSPVDSKSLENCSTAKPSSLLPLSRSGSALSMHGSTKSRAGSAVSRAGSRAGSRVGSSKRVGSPQGKVPVQNSISNSYPVDRTASLKYINSNSTVRDVRVVDNVTDPRDKEPMWSPQFSFIDRQTTNYCIGDLLPAMDKNIYNTTHSAAKLKFNAMDDEKAREDVTKAAERLHEFTRESQTDDGYLLLKKGMDILTGAADKVRNIVRYNVFSCQFVRIHFYQSNFEFNKFTHVFEHTRSDSPCIWIQTERDKRHKYVLKLLVKTF